MGIAGMGLAADSMRRLRDTLATSSSTTDSLPALQEICDAVHELLNCDFVVMHTVHRDLMEVTACSGEDAQRLVGHTTSVGRWNQLLETGETWGQLRLCRDPRPFFDHMVYEHHDDSHLLLGDESHWGSLNRLVAPLRSPDGILVGALSLAAHAGAELPSEVLRTIAELFTAQAAIAIYQQRLRDRAAEDRLALRLSEERFRLAFDNAPVGIVEFSQVDQGLIMTRINRAAATLLGVPQIDMSARVVDDVMVVTEGEPLSQQLRSLLSEDQRLLRKELRLRRPDGAEFWGLVHAAPLPDVAGRSSLLCQITDVTEEKSQAVRLTQQARRDPLTGLPNRVVVLNRLDAVVAAAAADGHTGCVLFADLNDFKQVNDEQGHLVGDEVLKELAGRLDQVVRKTDTVGRFGGDEFVIVAYPLTLDEAAELSNRVHNVLAEPIAISGSALRVRVTIGVAEITGEVPAGEVLRQADQNMYSLRSRARPGVSGETG
ncbi:MAG: diguanylate cyclase [Nocardioidaceae bacterium]|nr:diguanylate cyclase [Nocardioidaceae bacterium]